MHFKQWTVVFGTVFGFRFSVFGFRTANDRGFPKKKKGYPTVSAQNSLSLVVLGTPISPLLYSKC